MEKARISRAIPPNTPISQSGRCGAKAMPKDDIALLFPQPFQQRRHVDLIGLVIAGHSIDYEVDPEPNCLFPLRFPAWHNGRERVAALVPRPGCSPIIAAHD